MLMSPNNCSMSPLDVSSLRIYFTIFYTLFYKCVALLETITHLVPRSCYILRIFVIVHISFAALNIHAGDYSLLSYILNAKIDTCDILTAPRVRLVLPFNKYR